MTIAILTIKTIKTHDFTQAPRTIVVFPFIQLLKIRYSYLSNFSFITCM